MEFTDSHTVTVVALSMTKGVTPQLVRHMEDCGVSPEAFFELSKGELSQALGLKPGYEFDDYVRQEALFAARREEEFMLKHHIRALFMGDDDYPMRLTDIPDCPIVIYQLGNCNLNAEHTMSVVGTRRCTAYGVDFTRKLVGDVASYVPGVLVVSGLAYGIDAAAHTAALEAKTPTVGVLAHGLHTLYPAAHRDLARRIIMSGGALLSEYHTGVTAHRRHFLERNRIVAALSDAVIVAESEVKGGAMSTANHAFNYSREVFAVPGRVNDVMSTGCNHLIRRNKAHLITCAGDLIDSIGWQPLGLNVNARMRSLFPELDERQKPIYDFLRMSQKPRSLDQIHQQTGIPIAELRIIMIDMELDGIVVKCAGNRYECGT